LFYEQTIQVAMTAVEPRPIRTSVGIFHSTPYCLLHVAETDTVIVPSSRPGIVLVPDMLLDTLRAAYQRGASIISFCTGALSNGSTGFGSIVAS
jgi:AraC family transcriptional activator FtrA